MEEKPNLNILELLNSNKSKGYSIFQNNTDFSVINSDGLHIAQIVIYPGVVEYSDLKNNRIYFADIYEKNFSELKNRESLPEIPTDICVDISSVALKLRPEKTITYSDYSNSNIKERILPYKYTPAQLEIVHELSLINSFSDLLNNFFLGRNNLSLVDIGSGYGEFPLELSKIKSELKITRIEASDLHPELMIGKLPELIKAGVVIKLFNAAGNNVPKNYCDIITLNAPQVFGVNAYAREAVSNAIKMLKTPGLLLLRLNEDSHDLCADKYDLSLEDQVGVRVRELSGLPPSQFTNKLGGNGSSSVFIIAKV